MSSPSQPNEWQSLACSLQSLEEPLAREYSETNPSTDRRLLYKFQPRKLQGYWTEAHRISVQCRRGRCRC